jgi:hypothetical protein
MADRHGVGVAVIFIHGSSAIGCGIFVTTYSIFVILTAVPWMFAKFFANFVWHLRWECLNNESNGPNAASERRRYFKGSFTQLV